MSERPEHRRRSAPFGDRALSLAAALLVATCAVGEEQPPGTGPTCHGLLERAVDGRIAFDGIDFVDSSDPSGLDLLSSHAAFVEIGSMPDAYVALDKSANDCKDKGCNAALVGFSMGYGYASASFAIDRNSAVVTSVGIDWESTPFSQFGASIGVPDNQVRAQITTDDIETSVYYAVTDSVIEDTDAWTTFGGKDYGAIPLYVFGGEAKRASKFSCDMLEGMY